MPHASPDPRLFDDGLALILGLEGRRPHPALPRRLDALFRELAAPDPRPSPDEVEELIWAVWISHPDAPVADAMAEAVEALAAADHRRARRLLDRLVADEPTFAEAWNKRATLAFIEGRDAESLADIVRTLELEPRHFGAVAGFGQIALRHGRRPEARAAFQVALRLHPHLQGLREAVAGLEPRHSALH
jgi:tetratricopeptide (TPR) repeat protein